MRRSQLRQLNESFSIMAASFKAGQLPCRIPLPVQDRIAEKERSEREASNGHGKPEKSLGKFCYLAY